MACEIGEFDDVEDCVVIAGVEFIYYSSQKDVLSISPATNHTVATIVNKTGKFFKKFPASKRSMQYLPDVVSDDPDSKALMTLVKGYIKNITALNQKAMDNMSGELILIVGLNSGKVMIVGDLLTGAYFSSSKGDSGTNQSGQKNGYAIEFKKEGGTHTDYVYSGDAQLLLQPGP
jgi:hypothetical protein